MEDHYLHLHEVLFIIYWWCGPAIALYLLMLAILSKRTWAMPHSLTRFMFFAISSFVIIPAIAAVVWNISPALHTTGFMPEPGFPMDTPSFVALVVYTLSTFRWFYKLRVRENRPTGS